MKTNFNPTQYMLWAYKNYIGYNLYRESFITRDPDIIQRKLLAFCNSLVKLMNFKGFDYHYTINENRINIYNGSTLMVIYDISIFNTIKNENSLKFQLFVEWGFLMELNKKEKALIAL